MKMRKLMVMAGVGVVAAGIARGAEAADADMNQSPDRAQTPPVLLAFQPGFAPSPNIWTAPGPPPPMRRDRISRSPGPQFVWTPGSWAWNGRRWVWVNGGWVRPPRPRAVWVPGRWNRRGPSFMWSGGYWR